MRAEGYYWIRSVAFENDVWAIAEWDGNNFMCDYRHLSSEEVIEVDEKQITRQSTVTKSEIETGMVTHNGETRKSEVEVIQEISDSYKKNISTTFGESANSFVKE